MIKKIYGCVLRVLTAVCGIDFAKQFDGYLRFRRKLNLKNPQTLSDKVTYLFLHRITPLMSACTDKWAVRDYVAGKGLGDILIPAAGGPWSRSEDIDFAALPEKFIFKATHGCKMNYPVKAKSKLNQAACKCTLEKWLRTTYGSFSLEPHYKAIPPRIYAEELLDVPNGLIDYKFHCTNGEPQFVLVCRDRHLGADGSMHATLELFDCNWNSYCSEVLPPCQPTQPAPSQLKRMVEVSRILAADFPFVRVDLYEVNGKIYFGELTFSPASGLFGHFSDAFITEMGKRLTLPEPKHDR